MHHAAPGRAGLKLPAQGPRSSQAEKNAAMHGRLVLPPNGVSKACTSSKRIRKRRSKERDLVQAGFTDCRAAKNPPGILKIPAKSINILNN
jgi:hypothetical protein